MEVSTEIYQVYMKYVAPEDIQVYSIDEVLIDITSYLSASGLTAHQYAMRMTRDVLKTTGTQHGRDRRRTFSIQRIAWTS